MGQYGTVKKIVVNKDNPFKNNFYRQSFYSAYVTYENKIEASIAILCLDGLKLQNSVLKASFGMTKYCSFFINNQVCPNGQCYFLHKIAKK